MLAPDDGFWLWNRMDDLGGVEWPRIWDWESGDLPSDRKTCRHNFAILGQDYFFRRPAIVEALLDFLGRELSLDPETWRDQRPFLTEFIGSYFKATDRPAWIKIHAARTGFHTRTAREGLSARHRGSLDASLGIPVPSLPRVPMTLGGSALPRSRFRLFRSPVIPQELLRLRRIFIHRTLKMPEDRSALWSTEERLVAVHDDRDLRTASRGATPALVPYRDRSDLQSSPLISLSRLDERNEAQHRCFSLRPLSGEIIDFRACSYTPEYYFRSDMTTHTMIERLLTPGAYGTF